MYQTVREVTSYVSPPCTDSSPPVLVNEIQTLVTVMSYICGFPNGSEVWLLTYAPKPTSRNLSAITPKPTTWWRGLTVDQEELADFIVKGDSASAILGGSGGVDGWEFMLGVCAKGWWYGDNVECKQVCDFLTSFDVQWLFGVDLCNHEKFYSLRRACLVSCGCDRSALQGCSMRCGQAEVPTPCGDNDDGQMADARRMTLAWLLGNQSYMKRIAGGYRCVSCEQSVPSSAVVGTKSDLR